MKHADGTETRIRWKAAQWNLAARYFLERFPQLCQTPELPGLTIKDVMEMQTAVIEPSMHRTKSGMHMSNVRMLVWRQLEAIRAESEGKTEEKVLPEVIETHLPAGATPVFADLKAKDGVQAVEEHDEGESQLMFLKPVAQTDHHPAYTIREMLGKPAEVPAPMGLGHKLNLDWMNRPMTPQMAMQEVGTMSIGTLMDMLADKVADRLAARMAGTFEEQIKAAMGQLQLGKPEAKAEVKPTVMPAQAQAKPVQVKPEDKGSMKDQLIQLAKTEPKLRKPKIVIIGMQPGQAKEIDREFPQFEIVHVGHANDNAMAKMQTAHKVIGVEQKLGTYQRKIRQMHGTNFSLLKFSMTSIRHQLSVWATCYNEDGDYFKMNDMERQKADHEFAHA